MAQIQPTPFQCATLRTRLGAGAVVAVAAVAGGWLAGPLGAAALAGMAASAICTAALVHSRFSRTLDAIAGAAREVAEGNDRAQVDLGPGVTCPAAVNLQDAFNEMVAHVAQNRRLLVSLAEDARASNRAKSAFLANMSHELRTPLNAILGFSEVMKTEIFGPMGSDRYRAYAGDVHESGRHLLNIVNDLLDLSKIEAGEFVVEKDPFSPVDAVETVVAIIEPIAAERKLSFVHACEVGHDIKLMASAVRMRQVLLNLLSNATKYTPPGGRISLECLMEEDDTLVFRISDTGIGMNAEELTTALKPFGQVENSYNRTRVGTGLGLPLTKQLIEVQGGTMVIDSAPGKGTTVSVAFPRDCLLGLKARIGEPSDGHTPGRAAA